MIPSHNRLQLSRRTNTANYLACHCAQSNLQLASVIAVQKVSHLTSQLFRGGSSPVERSGRDKLIPNGCGPAYGSTTAFQLAFGPGRKSAPPPPLSLFGALPNLPVPPVVRT